MSGRHNQFFFLSMAKGHGRRGAGTRASGRGSLSASLTREKVPMDEVDQFADARDKILLDERPLYEPDEEEENFGADNREVLGLDETDDGDEEADSEDEQLDEGEEVNDDQFDEDEDTERYRTMYIPEEIAQAATSRRALRDEAHEEQEEPEDDSDADVTGWGANKRSYYSGNTEEDFESDSDIDEEKARSLEKNEALRLQRLSRADMGDSDFGLDDIDAVAAQENADEQSDAARAKRRRELDSDETEQMDENVSVEERLNELQRRSPLVLALIDELRDSLTQLRSDKTFMDRVVQKGDRQVAEIVHLYYQTLSSYVMLLTFFFELASAPGRSDDPQLLLEHPVMERLAQFKRALVEMRSLGLLDSDETSEGPSLMGPPTDEDLAYEELGDLEANELNDLIEDEKENQHVYAPQQKEPASNHYNATKSAQPRDEMALAEQASEIQGAKTKRKTKAKVAKQGTAAPLASVADVAADVVRPAKRSAPLTLDDDAYGEPTQMREGELQDKALRQRAVQFHVTGTPRTATPKQQLGGDEDIPYRDRTRSRNAVAAAKANRAAKEHAPVDNTLNDADWGEGDWEARDEVMEEPDDASYYDLVSSNKRARREAQKEAHDAARLAQRVNDESIAPGEHRAIDRTIEKNRGLTQNRRKNLRNPRVKRRMRFERANKRLSSTRAVYKGGQSALSGGYQGEKSGISPHLVKSRSLGS